MLNTTKTMLIICIHPNQIDKFYLLIRCCATMPILLLRRESEKTQHELDDNQKEIDDKTITNIGSFSTPVTSSGATLGHRTRMSKTNDGIPKTGQNYRRAPFTVFRTND